MTETPSGLSQRVDQWLWFARLTKSRSFAQALVERGKVRVNRIKIDKASRVIGAGDVLTLSLGPIVRSVEILAIAIRRGPAKEAQKLYRELTPAPLHAAPGQLDPAFRTGAQAPRPVRAGRPTKRDRRQLDKLKVRFDPL